MKFNKRIKIAPGIKVNLSKSGVSTTIGGKGLSVNTGNRGTYLNTSIPKTGLSNRQKISGGKNSDVKSAKATKVADEPAVGGIGFFGWVGVIVIVFGLGVLIF